jgi:hypothetical protein
VGGEARSEEVGAEREEEVEEGVERRDSVLPWYATVEGAA